MSVKTLKRLLPSCASRRTAVEPAEHRCIHQLELPTTDIAPTNGDVLAFRTDDVAALLVAAAAPPSPKVRPAWPEHDVAIVDTLAHCGLRVSELTGLTVGAVDRRGATPLLRGRSGSKRWQRTFSPRPLPHP